VQRILNLVCVLLVLATHLWGGCVSCTQYFMFPGQADTCCKHNRCKENSKPADQSSTQKQADRECARLPFAPRQHGDFSDFTTDACVTIPLVPVVALSPATSLRDALVFWDSLAASPPDVVTLTGALRV
jgi:hypothetical protein